MDLLLSNLAMNVATKAGRLAFQGADSCLTQLSLEPGLALSDSWPMNTRSKLEWDEGGNVQQDNSSSSEQTVAALQRRIWPASGMKRKAGSTNEGRSKESISRREGQDPPSDEEKLAKCPKTTGGVHNGNFGDTKLKAECSTSEQSGDMSHGSLKENSHIQDLHPKQDYIHVRARRGQATDSHSLAERVRREKISERMKFLQDLVPGCSKVTGKTVMLDEIINYVQSLQHQIEFLSMKLAAIDSRLDSNLKNLLQKELVGHPRSPETALMGPHMLGGYRDYQSQPQIQQHTSSCNMDLRSVGTFCDSYLRRSMNAPVLAPLADTDCFMDSLTQAPNHSADGQYSSQTGFFRPSRLLWAVAGRILNIAELVAASSVSNEEDDRCYFSNYSGLGLSS